jgi:competence protein ComEC
MDALVALISPVAGSALAWLLYYPTHFLIGLVEFFNALPGSSVAVGKISWVQLLILYGLIGFSSISKKWQGRWWLAGLVAVMLVALPVWQTKISQFQVTVLATNQDQVLVIQDQGQVTLVNSGDADTVSFTVLPFLQKQGINHSTAPQSPPAETKTIASSIQTQKGNYQRVSTGQRMFVGSTPLELINADPPVLQLQIRYQSWLLLGEMKPEVQQKLVANRNVPQVQVLWWSGESLSPEFLKALKPKVAIASSQTLDLLLQNAKIPIYWTGRDGAIQWTPQEGFQTTIEATNKDTQLL